jgi:hypothetical protein
MAESETARCPKCGHENRLAARVCEALGGEGRPSCSYPLKSEIECLRSIDRSLKGIRRIAIWFLVVSILSVLVGFMAAAGAFR